MKMIKDIANHYKSDNYKLLAFFVLIFLSIFSPLVLKPQIAGDSLLYTESIDVIKTGIVPMDFVPMMILTTYLGLVLIMFFDLFFNNIAISWIVLDALMYISAGLVFYSLLKRIFQNQKISFIGTILFATNYAMIAFGLGYLMDMGGWLAYTTSIYFSYLYLEKGYTENKWIYLASVAVGIGGL